MAQNEYIVHFKGDYSALAKDIKAAQGMVKKLEDDEVLLKINYDGNIKEYNKILSNLAKQHPELGIQFQYNSNEKILKEELDKLDNLLKLKADIDDGNVQKKLQSLADNIDSALLQGLDKNEVSKRLKDFYGYYNTALQAGAKNIKIDDIEKYLTSVFEESGLSDIFDEIWENNDIKPYKLLNIEGTIDSMVEKTKTGINEIESEMSRLEGLGAKKSQLPSEFEDLQEVVKILSSNLDDMKTRLQNLSGKAFDEMKRGIDETNNSLYITLNRLSEIEKRLKMPKADDYVDKTIYRAVSSHDGNVRPFISEGDLYNGTFATDDKKVGEYYTREKDNGYLYKGKIRAKRSEIYEILDPGSTWDKMLNLGNKEDAASREITKVYEDINETYDKLYELAGENEELKKNILRMKNDRKFIGDEYSYDGTIDEDYLKNYLVSGPGSVSSWLDYFNDAIVEKFKEMGIAEDKLEEITDKLKERVKRFFEISQDTSNMYGSHYTDTFGLIGKNLGYKLIDMYTNDSDRDAHSYFIADQNIVQGNPRLIGRNEEKDNSFIPFKIDQSQFEEIYDIEDLKEYISILDKAKVKEEEFLQILNKIQQFGGIGNLDDSSVKKISEIANTNGYEFDAEKLTNTAAEATQMAADAIKKAQDSNSPAELTKPLGKNFGEGYAEGIKEAIPDIVDACKQIVLAAYDAVKEANGSEDNEGNGFSEGFINSFKESLNNSLPDIQEKIKEIFSKLDINEEAYSNFETIGQNIVNSVISGINEHSQESLSDALERIISDAFTNIILNSAVQELIEKMQRAMDYYLGNTPLQISHFDVETDSIIISIQDALNNKTFNVDLSGTVKDLSTTLNTSAENVRMSFIDAIRWMQQANEWQKVNRNATHERALYFNSKTGEFSNPTVVGNEHSVTSELKNKVLDYYKKLGTTFDTDLHWHQAEDFAAPSYVTQWSDKVISGDLGSFFYTAFRDSFDKFVVAAQKELAVFDFTKIASSASELNDFLSKWITDNLSEVEDKLEYNQYRDENLTDNPRKTIALYLSQIYRDIWDDIKLGSHNIDYSSATLNQKQIRTHISDFGGNIMNYGEPNFMSLDTGELLPISDVFKDIIDKIRDSANVSSFEAMLNGIESDFEEVIVEIFHNIFMSLGDMDNINLDTIRNQVDEDTTKVLTESVKNQRAISEYGLNNYTAEIRDTLFNLLRESFFKPAVALNQDRVELQKAGSMAMKELISSNDLVGKLVKYYTPEEFEKEFGVNFSKNINQQQSDNSRAQLPFSPTLPEDFQEQLQNAVQDAIQSVINSIPEMISSSFATSDIGELIATKIQEAFEEANLNSPIKLYYFDVNTDNIVIQIQDALQHADFKIDISGGIQDIATVLNTTTNNIRTTFLDAVKWMREADKWQNDEGTVGARERKLYYNTKTGEFSNPSIIGGDNSTPAFLDMVGDYKRKGTTFDTSLHTHLYDDYAFPSSLGNAATGGMGDIDIWFKNAYSSIYGGIYETISKFVVGAQKEYVEFDFSKIASNAEELEDYLTNWIEENFEKVKEVLGEDASDYMLNPRKVAGLYVGKKLINLAHEKQLQSGYTPYNDVEKQFEAMFHRYEDKGWLESQVTGELLSLEDIFNERSPLKISEINLFDTMPKLLNEALDKIVTKIRTWITTAADLGENIGTGTIEDAVDNALSTTLIDDKFSELSHLREKIKKGFVSYFTDEFTQGRFSVDGIQTWDEAGSIALHELIDTDDLIGKIVRYYTPDEFEKNFGAKLPANLRPIKQYNTRDFMKWGVDDQGNHLRNGLSFDDLDSDEIIEWKKRLLQYFPELIESQAEELYNFMKSDYGNDFGFDEQFIAKINGYVAQNARQQQSNISQTQLPFSPILPEDFQAQLQNAIEESGKYLIKVYGELVDGFKSQLQQDIDEIGYLFVELKGRLSDDFKEALQSAIDSLGAIPIEVKPYVRKGSEIEEVDLPGGDQAGVDSKLVNKTTEKIKNLEQELENIEARRNEIVNSEEFKTLFEKAQHTDGLSNEEKTRYFQLDDELNNLLDQSNSIKKQIESLRFDNITSQIEEATQETDIWYRRVKDVRGVLQKTGGFFANSIELTKSYMDEQDSMVAAAIDKSKFLTVDAKGARWDELWDITESLEKQAREKGINPIDYIDLDTNTNRGNTKYVADLAKALGYLGIEIQNIIDVGAHGKDQNLIGNIIQVYDESVIKKLYNITDAVKGVKDEIEELNEVGKIEIRIPEQFTMRNSDFSDVEKELYEKIYGKESERRHLFAPTADSLIGRTNDLEVYLKRAKLSTEDFSKEGTDLLEQLRFGKINPDDFLQQYEDYLSRWQKLLDQQSQMSGQTPDSTSSTEADTKALLSKKEVVEQLRAELNLTKKAAEELFNEQGYSKTNGKYQIEQQAIDELIASLKEKKQVEESEQPTGTSTIASSMQEEVSVVDAAIEAEKKKFDELKNKISKTIPNAIKTKNTAFEKERDLVAKVVDDEIDYFELLENSVNGVTKAIENQYDTTKNAKPKTDNPNVDSDKTEETSKPRKTKMDLSSLDKIEKRIRDIGLSAETTEKAIELLGGGKQTFFWLNKELEDQWDKVQELIDIYKLLGIVIESVDDSDAFNTTVSTKSILDFDKQKYQSVGQKSEIQQQMSQYYSELEEEASKAYSNAEKKANNLLEKVNKLQNSNKYTQEFKADLDDAEAQLRSFLKGLSEGSFSFEKVEGKIEELGKSIENTLGKKAFNNVKLAAEKSLTNVGLKIDQIKTKFKWC